VRTVYRVLASLVALEVVVQAAALALGFAGLAHWVNTGGVADSASIGGEEDPFPEAVGFLVHGINGSIVVPALALLLVVASFFAGVRRGTAWALGVLGLVVVQVMLGFSAADVPALGAVHGTNALLLFTTALLAARRARAPRAVAAEAGQPAAAEVSGPAAGR
jgi:heme A synthase